MLTFLLTAALASCNPVQAPLIAAHRGGMDSHHPENTLPAVGHALQAGADVIELDLRATADGHPVVLHDASVDRTTDGQGRVQDLTLASVKGLSTGAGVEIPTLREVLASTRALNTTLLLDLKPAPGLDLAAVARTVVDDHDPRRVLFGVRSLEDRDRLAAAAPNLRYLGFVPQPDSIDSFLAAGITAIRLWPAWIARDAGLVRQVKEAGGQVWVTSGAASVEELRQLARLGADALLTDRPAEAVAALGCRRPPFTR